MQSYAMVISGSRVTLAFMDCQMRLFFSASSRARRIFIIFMHVNDSFFWVVSGFTKMEVGTAYKTLTLTVAVMGVVLFAGVAILGPLLRFA